MKYGLTEAEKCELERIKKRAAELVAKSNEKDPIEEIREAVDGSRGTSRGTTAMAGWVSALCDQLLVERAEYEKEITRLKSRSTNVTYATSSYWR